MINRIFLFVVLTLLMMIPIVAIASEADYVQEHCEGTIEHVLPDRTRVDCLTNIHAIEYDFGKKWAQSVAQSMHYAANTGKRAGIVIIIEDNRDRIGYDRLMRLVNHYGLPIDVERVVSIGVE